MDYIANVASSEIDVEQIRTILVQGDATYPHIQFVLDPSLSGLSWRVRGYYRDFNIAVISDEITPTETETDVTVDWYVSTDFTTYYGEMQLVLVGTDALGETVVKALGNVLIGRDFSISTTQVITQNLFEQLMERLTSACLKIDQTLPQRFVGGIPKLAADREISDDNDLVDKKHVADVVATVTADDFNHNDTSNIQGGSTTERYHMTQAENAALHAHSNKTALDAVSGTNTGDQDVFGAISTHNNDAGAHAGLVSGIQNQINLLNNQLQIINASSLFRWRQKRAMQSSGTNAIINVGLFGTSIGVGYYADYPMTLNAYESKGYFGLLREFYKAQTGDIGIGWKPAYSPVAGINYWTNVGIHWSFTSATVTKNAALTDRAGDYTTCQFEGNTVSVVLAKNELSSTNVGIYVDDVLKQTVNLDLASGLKDEIYIVTLSGLSSGTHTLKLLNNIDYKNMKVIGLCELKSDNGVRFINMSRSGAKTDYLENTTTLPSNEEQTIGMLDYDLIIFELLANDAAQSVDINTYASRIERYVDIAVGNGSDVILLSAGVTSASYPSGTDLQYVETLKQIAISKSVCFVNIFNRWEQGVLNNQLEGLLHDGVHPNLYGHTDIFKAIKNVLEL